MVAGFLMRTPVIVTLSLVGILVGYPMLPTTLHVPNIRGAEITELPIFDGSAAQRPLVHRLSRIPDPNVRRTTFFEPVKISSADLQHSGRLRQPELELTLEQLESMALDNHPTLQRAAAQIRALQGKWLQSGLAPNPTIGYIATEMGSEGTAGQQGGFINQTMITGGKLHLNRAVVSQEIMRAKQHFAAQRQRVLTDVRTGYYDVLIAQRKLALARELVHVSEQAVRTSENLFHGLQEIPRIGLLQSQIEAQKSRIVLRRAENENTEVWRRLASVLGRSEFPPTRLVGDLHQTATDLQWEEQLEQLMSRSPEISAAMAELERARWSLHRAVAQVKPNVNLQFAVQQDSVIDDTLTSLQVGLPLPLWNRNQGGIRQAQNEIVAAERNIDRVTLNLRRKLATVFRQYADARYQVEKFSSEILPTAEETFTLVVKGYEKGDLNFLAMLTAQRTYFETNLSYIEALRESWRTQLQMDGLLLESSLQQADER